MITLGCITLVIFILRCFVFTFRESPKFLLSKGLDAHALDVLYSIAHFNGSPEPGLELDDFRALDFSENELESTNTPPSPVGSRPLSTGYHAKQVAMSGFNSTFGHLKGLFANKRNAYLFVIIAIA